MFSPSARLMLTDPNMSASSWNSNSKNTALLGSAVAAPFSSPSLMLENCDLILLNKSWEFFGFIQCIYYPVNDPYMGMGDSSEVLSVHFSNILGSKSASVFIIRVINKHELTRSSC